MIAKLKDLTPIEITNLLNCIYSLTSGKKLSDIEVNPRVNELVERYNKQDLEKRTKFVEKLIEKLKEKEYENDIISFSRDVLESVYKAFYQEPLVEEDDSVFLSEKNAEQIRYRLSKIGETDKVADAKLIECLEQLGDNKDISAVDMRDLSPVTAALIEGLAKTYAALSNDGKKVDFIERVDDYYDGIYHDRLFAIITKMNQKDIKDIFSRVACLSPSSQFDFYDNLYTEANALYIKLENRDKKDFGNESGSESKDLKQEEIARLERRTSSLKGETSES